MKNLLLMLLILIISLTGFSQNPQGTDYELELIGRVWFPGDYHPSGDTTGISDCWGYTAPDGTEYAIIGVYEGIAFVRVPDLQIIGIIPGPKDDDYYYHRDIKTYKHYAYAVAEMTGTNAGLMIMDLQYLPDSVRFVKSYVYPNNTRSHNFSIDTAKGFAYICSQNYLGFRVVDLSDPENPVDVKFVNTGNIHDVFAQNDTVYVAEGFNRSYSVYNLTDKNNPVLLKRWVVLNGGYAHNIWVSEDGKFAMTTEETLNKTVKLWDISDLENIDLKGDFLAENKIAHNTHIMENLAYISHYRSGVQIVDISNPDSIKEVAGFPTYGGTSTGEFYGNWGTYPFTKAGYIYGSDLEGWLTVLRLHKPTSVEENNFLPNNFSLSQNYPNPFNPKTVIGYQLPVNIIVTLKIYDVLGREVATLVDEYKPAGRYEVEFNASNLSSGTYFYRLQAGDPSVGSGQRFVETKRLTLLK